MQRRNAFGLAILTVATSCVAPGFDRAAPRAVAASPTPDAAKEAAAVPAGPSAALLAKAPPPSLADVATLKPAPPFSEAAADAADAARALNCLTAAVYYEARSEPVEGQEAVAQVVLNRVRNPAFPNSVCGTVYEGSSRETGCQFTFTCDGSLRARREPEAWERARRVAEAALAGFVYAPVGSATYYHTTAVHPWWAAKVTRVARIGAHIFYRLPGAWGGALAFHQRYGGVEPAVSAGTRLPEKATDSLIETVEAGVTVHRGGDSVAEAVAAPRQDARRFGITVHRGSDASEVRTNGVVVHVTRGSDSEA